MFTKIIVISIFLLIRFSQTRASSRQKVIASSRSAEPTASAVIIVPRPNQRINRPPTSVSFPPKPLTALEEKPKNAPQTTSRSMMFIRHTQEISNIVEKKSPVNDPIQDNIKDNERAADYLREYVLEKTKHQNAKVIQDAFRSWKKRKKWDKNVVRIVKRNKEILLLCFLNWKFNILNNAADIRNNYMKFIRAQNALPFLARGRDFSPFQYFYISNQLFIPKRKTASDMYAFVYLFNSFSIRKVFGIWHDTAVTRRQHRLNLKFIRYTNKKSICFGPIFRIFLFWRRFAQFSKKTKLKYDGYISINGNDVSPHWKIVEKKFNLKFNRQERAVEFSRKRIMTKTVRALFNKSINAYTTAAVNEQADIFRNKQLQNLAHRAWLRYMELMQHKRQLMRDCVREWYAISYEHKKMSTLIGFYREHDYKIFIEKFIKRWHFVTHIGRLWALRKATRIHRKASLALTVICAFTDRIDEMWQLLCWRGWIRFIRARRRFKAFAEWHRSKPQSEFAREVVCQLKHLAQNRMIGRMANPGNKFIERKLGFNIETMIAEVQGEEISLRNAEDRRWHGDIAPPIPRSKGMDYGLLIRVFILALNNHKSLQLYGSIPRIYSPPVIEPHSRTEEELFEMNQRNAAQFKKLITSKFTRDRLVLMAIKSHNEALSLGESDFRFTAENNPIVPKLSTAMVSEIDLTQRIDIFDGSDELYKRLIEEVEQNPPRIVSNFGPELKSAIKAFEDRLREPSAIIAKYTETNASSSEEVAKAEIAHSKLHRNPQIFGYAKTASDESTNESLPFKSNIMYKHLCIGVDVSDMVTAVQRFLSACCGIQITVHALPGKSARDYIPRTAEASLKRKVIKNINNYIDLLKILSNQSLELLGVNNEQETFANRIISAVFHLHAAFRNSTQLAEFCDELPFEVVRDEVLIENTRRNIWEAIKQRHPRLELPVNASGNVNRIASVSNAVNPFGSALQLSSVGGSIQMGSTIHMSRARNISNSTFTTLGMDSEPFTGSDGYIVCLLLPYILCFDMVSDFLHEGLGYH